MIDKRLNVCPACGRQQAKIIIINGMFLGGILLVFGLILLMIPNSTTMFVDGTDYRGNESELITKLNGELNDQVVVTDLYQQDGVITLNLDTFTATSADGGKKSSLRIDFVLFSILNTLLNVDYVDEDFIELHITIAGEENIVMSLYPNDLIESEQGSYFDLSRFL